MNGSTFSKRNNILVLLFGIVILFLPVLFIEFRVLQYTGGVFMYPFDDTFIHLQIAKNLTQGHWGISDQFASASSSGCRRGSVEGCAGSSSAAANNWKPPPRR